MTRPQDHVFDRWWPHGGSTIAHRLVRNDLVDLNTFCWNAHGVINHAQRALAQSAGSGPISTVLNFGSDPGRRADTPIADAKDQLKEVDNWARLAAVVFASSSLELFVRRVVRLSLQSDPGLMIGVPRVLDGVVRLKSRDLPNVDQQVRDCTEDVWPAREEALAAVFQGRVTAVFANLSSLEFLRRLRNSVAHDFARMGHLKDFWYLDPEQAEPQPVERISPDRLKRLLRVIGAVVTEIEERARQHIGSFELMVFWDAFLRERAKPRTSAIQQYIRLHREGAEAKLLSTFHHRMVGGTLGREYCAALIRHYRQA